MPTPVEQFSPELSQHTRICSYKLEDLFGGDVLERQPQALVTPASFTSYPFQYPATYSHILHVTARSQRHLAIWLSLAT